MPISYSLGSLLTIDQIFKCVSILEKNKPDIIWIPETWGMENFAMLGSISTMIQDVKIGSSIINTYSRSPALIAMGSTTLDIISKGRFILGLGASTNKIVEDFHGYKYNSQLLRMKEYVEIIKLILTHKKIYYDGHIFKLKNFTLLIKPIRHKIPIYLAAVNKNMIALAEEIADGAILYLRPIENIKTIIKKKNQNKQFKYTCQFITCMSNDVDKAISRVQKTLAFYISVSSVYRNFLAACGFKHEVDNIYAEFLSTGFQYNYKLVTKPMLDSLTIYGNPEDCIRQLIKIKNIGIDLPIIQFNPPSKNNIYGAFDLLVKSFSNM